MKDSTKHAAVAAAALVLFLGATAGFLARPRATITAHARGALTFLPSAPALLGPASTPAIPPSARPAPFRSPTPSVVEISSRFQFGRRWADASGPPEFGRFAQWLDRYLQDETFEKRRPLEAEGIHLATERRAALAELIRMDPAHALDRAVPFAVRKALPASVAELLEEPIDGRGALKVLAALPAPGREADVAPVIRTVVMGDREFEAFVHGRRVSEPTRQDIPLHGIAVGRLLAVSEHAARLLEAAEAAGRGVSSTEPICSVSGQTIASEAGRPSPVVNVGGRLVRLCGVGHLEAFNQRLLRAEAADDGPGAEVAVPAASPGSAYTVGTKRLLILRVDFPDRPGEPLTTNAATALIGSLNEFFRESSRGRAGFHPAGGGSAVTPTLRLPNAAAFYGTNNLYSRLQNEARAAAAAAGFNPADYDFDLTCFGSVPGWAWSGLGWVGEPGAWLHGRFTTGIAAHELGHNFGLNHANFWDTSGRSVIGAGFSAEYGDVYDTMGVAGAGAKHFNARYKHLLNWLNAAEVQTVMENGVYRIMAHDDPNASGIQALRIPRSGGLSYWVEFRQRFGANPWMMNGVTLRRAGNGHQKSELLDTTPGSPDDRNDAALVPGRTFSDPDAGIHITTLRKAGTMPESIDVMVNLGVFPGNTPPTVNLAASATRVAPSDPVEFLITASDLNGDALAYHWEFGDGTFGTNGASASKYWNSPGEYRVQCTISDMKGGTARQSVIIIVGEPHSHRISGRVSSAGFPVMGAKVQATPMKISYTDSDGTYSIVGLPPGVYSLEATFEGMAISPAGFQNPVVVGPNATAVNFAFTNRTFVPPEPPESALQLSIDGRGTIRGVTNAQRLRVGKVYRLTAVPEVGSLFSHWSGSVGSRTSTLAFVMEPNFQLTAHFVPNPFVSAQGSYAGLFHESDRVQHERSGSFHFTLSAAGAYSASMLLQGRKMPMRGSFDLNGNATNDFRTADGRVGAIEWTLAMNGSGQIFGRVRSEGWLAALGGDRLTAYGKTNPRLRPERYTFVITGDSEQNDAPRGNGFGTVQINARGIVRLSAYLPDNSRFVGRSPIGQYGDWPLHASLYARQGSILGWMVFRDLPSTDLDAVLIWTCPPRPNALAYQQGFVSEAILQGSTWLVTSPNEPQVVGTNSVLRFESGGSAEPWTCDVAVLRGAISAQPPRSLSGKLNRNTGLFSGSALNDGERLKFRGALLPKTGTGSGYFLGVGKLGRVTLESR